MKRACRSFRFEFQVLFLSLCTGLPGVLLSIWLLWSADLASHVRWILMVLLTAVWIGLAHVVRGKVRFPLQTVANLLSAIREGDFSMRARGARYDDSLGQVMAEVNTLGEILRTQRLGAEEASALLRTVMSEIDIAVFTFDGDQRLRLVNRAGERLLARPMEQLLGRTAAELGLAHCLQGEAACTMHVALAGGLGRWGMRRSVFRQGGLPHYLVVLTDLSQTLRDEERQAWQRLVRVLSHELNNSLAPIKSIATSLESSMVRSPRASDWEADMRRGLGIISGRAESLARFMQAYASLARLPIPKLRLLEVGAWIKRVAGLETRIQVKISLGPELAIQADPDQIDQLLINLVRNAVDAALETNGEVQIGWSRVASYVEVYVQDGGPGLTDTANLFVPFFTTKPKGSGIGLVLSRQIAEAHGGTLILQNRSRHKGCEARLRLPLSR